MTDSVSLAIINAHVWTGTPAFPKAEAVAVCGERIVAVGSNQAITSLAAAKTKTIDAQGALLVPGFIDSHLHFLEGGFRLASVQLRDARTPQEFVARIANFANEAPPGSWITGGDWDHELWGGTLPEKEWIDGVSAGHPVWVNRLDGHMALANRLALDAAGIRRESSEVDGGEIVRNPSGEPTGILKDNAMALVERVVSPPSEADKATALQAAMDFVSAQGVTSVHHVGTWDDLKVFQEAHRRGRLKTRIYASIPLDSWERLAQFVADHGNGDHWLKVGGVKGFVDGSLGSHTAAFKEPYSDASDNRGLFVNSRDDLYKWIKGADKAGLQAVVHAIGDRAIADLLGIFEQVAEENGPRDRRFRIEHAQHLAEQDIPRFVRLGVIASMQPYHAIDDGRWAEKVIGPKRAQTTYAFRSLLDAGVHVAFGSDWYVAPPTPLEGIYAAVSRRTLDGKHHDGWVPRQKILVEEALRAYTCSAAYASFDEAAKGTLEPGKLADFVLLDRDITKARDPEEIRQTRIALTVLGGVVVYPMNH